MRGQVLEVDCDQPEVAVRVLRRLNRFDEVALYGVQIHVVSQDVEAQQSLIVETLEGEGVDIASLEVIIPSLEDVFVSSIK